jgi:hypothetical protein
LVLTIDRPTRLGLQLALGAVFKTQYVSHLAAIRD